MDETWLKELNQRNLELKEKIVRNGIVQLSLFPPQF